MTWIYLASAISIASVIVLWLLGKRKAARIALTVAEGAAKITPTDIDDDLVKKLRDIVDEDE